MATFKYNQTSNKIDVAGDDNTTVEGLGSTEDFNTNLTSFQTLNFPDNIFSGKNYNGTDRTTHVMSFFLFAPSGASTEVDPAAATDEESLKLVKGGLGSDYLAEIFDNTPVRSVDGLNVSGVVTKGERLRIKRTGKVIKKVINLFMPDTINNDLNIQYNSMELMSKNSKIGTAASIADIIKTMGKSEASLTAALHGLAADLSDSNSVAGKLLEASRAGLGITINPQAEVLFNTVDFRRYNYDFILTPKNKIETQQVQDIIKLFRTYAVPKFVGNATGRFMTAPGYFEIKYLTLKNDTLEVNPWVIKSSTCVLTNCNIDYAPTGWTTHDDGAPISYRMNLQFQELELLHRDRIAKGY